jgi:hypothetical protein
MLSGHVPLAIQLPDDNGRRDDLDNESTPKPASATEPAATADKINTGASTTFQPKVAYSSGSPRRNYICLVAIRAPSYAPTARRPLLAGARSSAARVFIQFALNRERTAARRG